MCKWVTLNPDNMHIPVRVGPGFGVANKCPSIARAAPPVPGLTGKGLGFGRTSWTSRCRRHWIPKCEVLFQLVNGGELQKVFGSGKPQDWMDNLIESEGWCCQSRRLQLGCDYTFQAPGKKGLGRVWEEGANGGRTRIRRNPHSPKNRLHIFKRWN